jgi:hypothetical protein
MRRVFSSLSTLVAFACFGCAQPPPGGIYYASGEGSVTPEGLHRVDWEAFGSTYVMPGADLQRYDKVLVQEVTVSYETPPRPARGTRGNIDPNYALSDSAMEALKRHYHDEFARVLGKSRHLSVTDSPGPDVLLISGYIVDLKITAPPVAEQAWDERVYTASSGRMTLVLDVRDSESGAPLVRVGQTRAIEMRSGRVYESGSVGTSAAIREVFRSWAYGLRRELHEFRSIPELPPAPSAKR